MKLPLGITSAGLGLTGLGAAGVGGISLDEDNDHPLAGALLGTALGAGGARLLGSLPTVDRALLDSYKNTKAGKAAEAQRGGVRGMTSKEVEGLMKKVRVQESTLQKHQELLEAAKAMQPKTKRGKSTRMSKLEEQNRLLEAQRMLLNDTVVDGTLKPGSRAKLQTARDKHASNIESQLAGINRMTESAAKQRRDRIVGTAAGVAGLGGGIGGSVLGADPYADPLA